LIFINPTEELLFEIVIYPKFITLKFGHQFPLFDLLFSFQRTCCEYQQSCHSPLCTSNWSTIYGFSL